MIADVIAGREPWWCEHGKSEVVLATLPDGCVDAVVTDPPYGLEFMGKEWDSFGKAPTGGAAFTPDGMGKGFAALPSFTGSPNPTCRNCKGSLRGNDRKGFSRCRCDKPDFPNSRLRQMVAFQEWFSDQAKELFRVLKPGGHLLAFGGSRTYHRLACAIEDAGFEIRDQIMWLYGSGFPKSLDVGKAIDKMAGAEREIVGRKGGRYASPKQDFRGGKHHHGADTQKTALFDSITAPATEAAKQWDGWGTALKPAHEPIVVARKPLEGTVVANVLKHGTGALNIDACRIPGEVPQVTQGVTRRAAIGEAVYGGGHGVCRAPQQGNPSTLGRWAATPPMSSTTAAMRCWLASLRQSAASNACMAISAIPTNSERCTRHSPASVVKAMSSMVTLDPPRGSLRPVHFR